MSTHAQPQSSVSTAREMLRHALATLAYRGGKALRETPSDFDCYEVAQGARTPAQILSHMCDLMDWTLSMAKGTPAWIESKIGKWDDDVARFHAALAKLDDLLASDEPLGAPAEKLFQGPIADALTHVGQLTMLRRLAGGPIKFENYYKAEVTIGRVGPDQPAPRREIK